MSETLVTAVCKLLVSHTRKSYKITVRKGFEINTFVDLRISIIYYLHRIFIKHLNDCTVGYSCERLPVVAMVFLDAKQSCMIVISSMSL